MCSTSYVSSSPDRMRFAAAVIVAGGAGARMGGPLPKQYIELLGTPVLLWSVRTFLAHPAIGSVVVVLPERDAPAPPEWLAGLPLTIVAGGAHRGASVRAGIDALGARDGVVLVHDAARPLVSEAVITRVLDGVGDAAAIAAMPVADTVKSADDRGSITGTVDRSGLWLAQTPQGFSIPALRDVHRRAEAEGVIATDDAGLCERFGLAVRIVEGAPENLKITTPADLRMAELLAAGTCASGPVPPEGKVRQ